MQDYAAAREMMVDCQVRPSDVTRYGIVDAMLTVPRERFVPPSKRAVAYAGEAVEQAKNRWLLDPRVFAKMVDFAEINPEDVVLDIGCGLGYSSAVLSRLCKAVIAVESDETMAKSAEETLSSLDCDNVAVLTGPLEAGAESEKPFDVILVQGGVGDVPAALFDQLAEDGRLVAIWSDGGFGQARVSTRAGDAISHRWAFDAAAPVLPGFSPKAAFAF
jgi:protein-L-isoaspartate(D-aspartate) O-methyltransferase